jgi:cysteate synthase
VELIDAKVLSNRRPPYSLAGGLYDALKDVGGEVLIVNNEDGRKAGQLFKEMEGIDIHPAAAIATASLVREVENGNVEKDALIMLNITGGGEERFQQENELFYLKPELMFDINPDEEEVKKKLEDLF